MRMLRVLTTLTTPQEQLQYITRQPLASIPGRGLDSRLDNSTMSYIICTQNENLQILPDLFFFGSGLHPL